MFCQNIYSDIAKYAKFQFFSYKSMPPLSCHSNKTAAAIAMKNGTFKEISYKTFPVKFELQWFDGSQEDGF